MLEKQDVKQSGKWIELAQRTVADSCEHGTERSGSSKAGNLTG